MRKLFPPRVWILAAFLSLAAAGESPLRTADAADSFMCPETHAATTGSALKETPADLASATAALKGPERENAIRVLAGDLKKKYPGADKAEIVNYMLTAYCPLVAAEDGLGADEKKARMDRFSSQVYAILGE